MWKREDEQGHESKERTGLSSAYQVYINSCVWRFKSLKWS